MTLALPSRTDACYVNPNPRYIYKWSKDQSSNLLPDRHKIHTAARISFIFFFCTSILLKVGIYVLFYTFVNVYILFAAGKFGLLYIQQRGLAIHVYVPQYRIAEVRSEERK